jgi:hypothetical protein
LFSFLYTILLGFLKILIMIIALLVSVAFFTLAERKVFGPHNLNFWQLYPFYLNFILYYVFFAEDLCIFVFGFEGAEVVRPILDCFFWSFYLWVSFKFVRRFWVNHLSGYFFYKTWVFPLRFYYLIEILDICLVIKLYIPIGLKRKPPRV